MIAGGGEIYLQSLPYLNRLYLTVIEKDFVGDAQFPEFGASFQIKESLQKTEPFPFSFRTYEQSPFRKVNP
jgi:dihydrofolate reductase